METTVDRSNPAYKHGHAGSRGFSPTYQSWACMVQRATNPKRPYAKHYVERGVTVCERWLTFQNFLADMGARPPGTTLDRIDNQLGYGPGNCRWANHAVQANNRTVNRLVTIGEETKTVTQWCEALGLSKNTVWARINKWGYSPFDALTRPKQDRVTAAKAMTAKRKGRTGP